MSALALEIFQFLAWPTIYFSALPSPFLLVTRLTKAIPYLFTTLKFPFCGWLHIALELVRRFGKIVNKIHPIQILFIAIQLLHSFQPTTGLSCAFIHLLNPFSPHHFCRMARLLLPLRRWGIPTAVTSHTFVNSRCPHTRLTTLIAITRRPTSHLLLNICHLPRPFLTGAAIPIFPGGKVQIIWLWC